MIASSGGEKIASEDRVVRRLIAYSINREENEINESIDSETKGTNDCIV